MIAASVVVATPNKVLSDGELREGKKCGGKSDLHLEISLVSFDQVLGVFIR